jgi:hypothetical protein
LAALRVVARRVLRAAARPIQALPPLPAVARPFPAAWLPVPAPVAAYASRRRE